MMRIAKTKEVFTDIPFIINEYSILHYDEEPILFSGLNRYNTRVIASSVDKDTRNKKEIFFYTLIDEVSYTDFVKGKVSYRDILSKSESIFLLQSSFNNESRSVYLISFHDIPEKYIPLEDSYCPIIDQVATLDYEITLKGLNAERHLGNPSEVNVITEGFKNIFTDSSDVIVHKDFITRVFIRPYAQSSFKIGFNIEILQNQNNISPKLFNYDASESYKEFLKSYIEYSINDLDKEYDAIVNNKDDKPKFNEVLRKAKAVFKDSGYKQPSDDFERLLLKGLEKSAEQVKEISQTVGANYNTLTLINKTSDGGENLLGIIDRDVKEKFENAFVVVESNPNKFEVDAIPREYKIFVYHLNANSRTGNAIVYEDTPSKPRFKITGKGALEGSIFTESLHFNHPISVMAKATRDIKTKLIKSLEIQFE